MDGYDEAEILDRAKSGDRDAFEQLVRHHQRRIYVTALHLMGNHSDADDVAQETFLRAYRALSRFDGRSRLSSWLHRIAINTALNHLRGRQRRGGLAHRARAEPIVPESVARGASSPEQHREVGQRCSSVLRAFGELSVPLRTTLALAVLEEMPYRQIAEVLEIPEGTVSWRVKEARKKLRAALSAVESVIDED